MNLIKKIGLFACTALLLTSCKEEPKVEETPEVVVEEVVTEEVVAPSTIVDVAVGNENFSTLVAAVKAANLVETLSGDGPFTVFAPTNDAFAKLPAGTVDNLLKPENVEMLKSILTYHVVAGKFEAAAVIEAINANNGKFTVDTVQGGKIVLSLKDGNVMLTDGKGKTATVVMADVPASNGVIHAIDAVVMAK